MMNDESNKQTVKKPVELRFKLFFVSSALLMFALCGLTYVEFYMEPSVKQEMLGLISLSLGAIAGVGVIIAYIAILWSRLKRFFTSEGRQ
jgi:nitrate reductase gamma subunit